MSKAAKKKAPAEKKEPAKKTKAPAKKKKTKICFGDKVELGKQCDAPGQKGVIRFIGELDGKIGTHFGIELDMKKGNTDGKVGKVQYFKTQIKKGIFVKEAAIKSHSPGEQKELPRIAYGDKVKVPKLESEGTVRFIGFMDGKDFVQFGIELKDAKGKNDGMVKKRRYFACEPKHGTFQKPDGVELPGKKPKKNDEEKKDPSGPDAGEEKKQDVAADASAAEAPKAEDGQEEKEHAKTPSTKLRGSKIDVDPDVGDKIELKPDRKGQVMWKGEEKAFGIGVWYGVQLTEARGDCNGVWKDKKYFFCENNYGQYVQKRFIVRLLSEEEANFDFSDVKAPEEDPALKEARERRQNIRALKEKFKETDTDGSLSLEVDEFTKMAVECLGCTVLEATQLFQDVDASGNGSVSFAEFDAWLRVGGGIDKLNTYGKLKQAFVTADTDGSLQLDLQEFTKMAKDAMDLNEEDAKIMFQRIDAKGNGDITFAEFEAWVDDLGGIGNIKQYAELKQAFHAADKDSSGEIDFEEFQTLAKEKLGWNKFKSLKVFKKIDLSNDDKIQLNEFEAWVEKIGGVHKVKAQEDVKEDTKEEDEAPEEANAEAEKGDAPAEDAANEAEAPAEAPAEEENAEAPAEEAPAEEAPAEEAPADNEDG